MSVSKPPPPPSTSHLAIPPASPSTFSSAATSPSAMPHSVAPPPPSPVKISMQEHFAINVCPGPILPIPQISDFFPRFHDYPCTPPPPREKKILKEETFNGETGIGYKDGERRVENDGDREEVFESDDEDSEFRGEGKVLPCGNNKKFFLGVGRRVWQGLGPPFKLVSDYTTGLTLRK